MERMGISFHQNEPRNEEAYSYLGVTSRGTPVWGHSEVVKRDVKIAIGHAQANHWGYGGGGKLIMPGVASDETIESNHCNFTMSPQTHYGALAGPMRSDIDEIATMTGLDYTLNVLLDTRGRVIDIVGGSHPQAHRHAIEKFNSIYAYENPVASKGQADIVVCGVFAPTDHLFFHTGWGCIWAPIYEVMTRKHLTLVTLEENLEMAADIGIDATTSLDEAFAAAIERHGPSAKVIVLPYARYQLPANAVRLDAEPLRFPKEAGL